MNYLYKKLIPNKLLKIKYLCKSYFSLSCSHPEMTIYTGKQTFLIKNVAREIKKQTGHWQRLKSKVTQNDIFR